MAGVYRWIRRRVPGKEQTEESGQNEARNISDFHAKETKSPVTRKRGRKPTIAKLPAPAEAVSSQTMSHMGGSASEKSCKRQKTDKLDESKLGKISTVIQHEARTSGEGSSSGLLSPRRSGRGMVPNSRFKDMHLFSTGKKHQTSSSKKDTSADTGKQKSKGNSNKTAEQDLLTRKKGQSGDIKLNMGTDEDIPETKFREKPKLKTFSSGATLAMAQAKVQLQTEAKPRAVDKFSIKEIPEGLEVTGRDGIPVVVSAENIVRVPFPDKSAKTDPVNTSSITVDEPEMNSLQPIIIRSTVIMASDSGQAQSVAQPTTIGSSVLEAADSGQTKSVTPPPTGSIISVALDSGQAQSVAQPTTSGSTVFEALDSGQTKSVTLPTTTGSVILGESDSGQTKSVTIEPETLKEFADSKHKQECSNQTNLNENDELSPLTVSDVCVMEEVIESDVISTNTEPPPLSPNQSRRECTGMVATVTSLEQDQTNGEGSSLGEDSVATTHAQSVESDIATTQVSDTTTSRDSAATPDSAQSGVDQHLDSSNDISASEVTTSNKSAEMADKNKKLPIQFLKDASSSTPAKPGYIISSARKSSSVVKIVTLSSMLEGNSSKAVEKDEKSGTFKKLTDSDKLQSLPSEPSPVLDTESRPTGVDMILEGSKTVDAADMASCLDSNETHDSQADDSKFSSASTQTPIDKQGKKTIIPTIYKALSAPTLRTISVNLGKHELQEGEVGYESPGPGGRPKSEEYILVELPEGATIQQRYVKSRTRIDDSMFLSSESMSQGVYHCTLCNYKTSKKPNWYKHKKKHLGLREYACTQCEYRAATSSNLKRHMAIHEDVRAFSCLKCSLTFRQKIHLERHIKYKHEEKQIKCPFCDYMCANENPDLKVHIKRKHLPGDSPDGTINTFTCEECNLVTVSKRDLKQHMKFHRNGPELKLFCEHCSFVTDCESRLRRHGLIHTKEKPFQCGLCLYRGSQKEHVLRHMRSQHNIDVLRRRRKPLSNESPPVEGSQVAMKDISKLIDRTDYSTKDKIFACKHCTMKFSKLINLYKHLHTQHRNIMPSEREDDFSCVVCDFHTNTKKNLLVHMRKHNMMDHTPPSHLYSCVLCRYTNPKRRNLFQHMRKKHHIEIVMKDDGSTSCFVTDTSNIREDVDQNVLTVGDVVTATTAEADSHDDPNGVQGVISLEDLATIVTPEPNQEGNLIIDAGQLHNISLNSLVQQHEAAEAIEGLQALAGQINLADSVIEEVQVMDDPGLDPITMETTVETSKDAEEKSSIQLSAEQLLHLSSGDFVEINGEMYKVEITAEDSATATPTTLRAMAAEAENSHCQEPS
ncbi:zinc finger protein 236-like isoform X2 [Haliotis rubra]|uniref:zinc finger protein 236-like isoform X2 n=1 Tax=Haliotis rubra TaxID=36100 RepID=UPI001EE50EBB|nr:zinc finger protein 236-like isoform X2 [Haliotis rubra]